jgi:hypothetical protein
LTGNGAEAEFRASNRLDTRQVVRQSCEAEEIPPGRRQRAAGDAIFSAGTRQSRSDGKEAKAIGKTGEVEHNISGQKE